MSIGLLAVFFLVTFMIHEFDEIILVRLYLARAEEWNGPRGFWWRNRSAYISTKSIAAAIAEEFALAGIGVGLAVFLNAPEVIVGLLIPYCIHLAGHILDAAMVNRWVPGSVTSLITLPILIAAAWWFIAVVGVSWLWVAIWAGILAVILIANLQFMHRILMPAVESWLGRVYR